MTDSSRLTDLSPNTVSYNRFVELEQKVAIPFILFVKRCRMGGCTGISFVDSTALRVCRNQRIHLHKVFKGLSQLGKLVGDKGYNGGPCRLLVLPEEADD